MKRMNAVVVAVLAFAPFACGSSNSNGNGTADAPGGSAKCGDGICAINEVNSCPADCGTRGGSAGPCNFDGVCETTLGETQANCPSDCTGSGSSVGPGSGSGSGSGSAVTPDMCKNGLFVIECVGCFLGGSGACSSSTNAQCGQCVVEGFFGMCQGGFPDGMCESGEDASCVDCM